MDKVLNIIFGFLYKSGLKFTRFFRYIPFFRTVIDIFMRTVIIPDMSSSGAGRIIMIDKVFPSRARRYQHAFVYRRARGYVEAGYNVDMLCIRPRKIPCYREYDGIDVYEGYDAVLRKVLESMTYTETVFVHFLSPYIWNVLKHYLDRIRLVIFCHISFLRRFWAPQRMTERKCSTGGN